MKKFLISTLALFFVFATVHAQTTTDTAAAKTHKTKSHTTAMNGKHKASHAMHHKATVTKQKTKSTSGGTATPQQKPVAATTTTPSTKPTTQPTKATSKGAHYAVNSNGKKTYVKSPHSK